MANNSEIDAVASEKGIKHVDITASKATETPGVPHGNLG